MMTLKPKTLPDYCVAAKAARTQDRRGMIPQVGTAFGLQLAFAFEFLRCAVARAGFLELLLGTSDIGFF